MGSKIAPARTSGIPVRVTRVGRRRVTRAEALAQINRYLDASASRTLKFRDLCKASGVSERTLRSIFVEAFGLSPARYLRRRKLRAVRAELAVADPGSVTVASVARRYGLTDVGRMARDYCALFGEYPRATLLRIGAVEPRAPRKRRPPDAKVLRR
jgi:transcriptional regulator GlxA family with amidase domain